MRQQVMLVATVLLLCGCSGPQQEVRAVAQEFIRAGDNADWPRATATFTRVARAKAQGSVLSSKQKNHIVEFGKVTIDGENASIDLKDKRGGKATLLLRKEDNQWRIWGGRIYPENVPYKSITLNFEKPELLPE